MSLQLKDPTVRTAKRSGSSTATSAKYTKGRENTFMLRDTSSKSHASMGGGGGSGRVSGEHGHGYGHGYGGGSMTARAEGVMREPRGSENLTAQSQKLNKSKSDPSLPKDDMAMEPSISNTNLLTEDEMENE